MSRGKLIMVGMIVGSLAGGYIPTLFGVSFLSFISILGNAVGGFLGIWIVFKLTKGM